METLKTSRLSNTTFSIIQKGNKKYILLEYIGVELDFSASQWIKYHLFQWKPFVLKKYDLIFSVEPYCQISLAGWRLLLLIRRWLNYEDKKVFLQKKNQDLMRWIVSYKMEAHFPFLKENNLG